MRNQALVVLLVLLPVATVWSHCEIPCGIYNDAARIALMREHTITIEKSMDQIGGLQKQKPLNSNQLVRWVTNKEEHAQKIQDLVSQYFLTQRIKPVEDTEKKKYARYVYETTLLQKMLVAAMKCKQTTDTAHVTQLRQLIDAFEKSYQPKGHTH
jgi:nickel superoxide dismutase